ncbi:DUF6311 domain-containing protein [Sphingomonas sp.]|uniref:DUF6311 domain-containing protein n=1 Tax=Sphingomonas sp. TaxID=28214 RepID=UPI003341F44E
MKRIPLMLALIATASVLFAGWMPLATLDPRNIGWLLDGHDHGQSAIGLAAYLAGGGWPGFHIALLSAPEGTSLLLTDSIPLLGVLLGPFAALLPPGLQFVGPWMFACMVLQVLFAWALVRPHAPDAPTAWFGTVLLAALPMLFNRYPHASLCAQWLILWGLWIYVEPRRADRPLWWLAVLGVAALVHSYLLLMVASIWAAAILRRVVEGRQVRPVIEAVGIIATVTLLLAAQGVFGGGFGSTHSYGAFPMALDAWWNPANQTYSALLRTSPEDHGRGFEGLNYLGAGLLLTVAIAAATRRAGLRHLAWLLPGFAVLALVAIGPQPLFWGQAVTTLHLPLWLTDALDPVRASGRLGWPLTYTLVYAAVISVMALRRATILLAAAVALQAVDLAPMLAAIRATAARANGTTVFARTHDPRWAGLIARAKQVDFTPADAFINLAVMEEITWRAVAARRPVGFTYTARTATATKLRTAAERRAFERGVVTPGHLVIVQDGVLPATLAPRAIRIDGVTIIAP